MKDRLDGGIWYDVDQWFGLERADVECRFGRFGGADVGSLGMHVAHGGGFGVGLILLNLFCGELGPGVQVAGIDCVNPSGEDGREKGFVVECNAVFLEVWQNGGIG